ncbi:O-acyltransferase like protein-like [Trichoplusia ni]|uniref:O-acyltransferase like protein-like n=1 Tax=Trichoplusia ni TaxID=7111 RepID=A0A7E5VWL5_TRINI|nr:O-acyltransferase like protein-like [Trichoplusia ni]
MAWIVLGHTLSSENIFSNEIEAFEWLLSWKSLWLTASPISVDTFFTLSGFLVVYTTLGKFTGIKLLKNIHLFWLNRLLRLFPLLATVALVGASFLNRFGDGPDWGIVAYLVEKCRTSWWTTLTHTQNYMTPLLTWLVVCYWVLAFSLSTFILYADYATRVDPDQTVANLYNSFIRPLWALFIGSMIYMCVYGYGGPINWFLSLSVWKMHSRLSYGIYLIHSGLIFAINNNAVTTIRFSPSTILFKFLGYYTLSFIVAFFAVLIIDAPFSTLFKLLLGGGAKKPQKQETDVESTTKEAVE